MLETAVTVQADQTIPRQLGSAHRRPRPPRPWRARRRARRRWCKSRCYTAASPPACSRRRRRCCSRSRSLLSWTPARAARRPCHSLADRHRRHRHVLHPHQPYPRPTQMSFRSAAKEPQEHEALSKVHGAIHPELEPTLTVMLQRGVALHDMQPVPQQTLRSGTGAAAPCACAQRTPAGRKGRAGAAR